MVFIDGTVVNVALPTLQRDLRATAAAVQWIVVAYALLLAALILVGGSLGDQFGRRRIFLLGTMIFSGASVWCGLAPSVGQLIAARAVQGVGGALLTPASLAIISATFNDQEARGRAIGTWSGFTSVTTAFGPVLGGWLVEHASWRWVFFINLPLAAIVLLITLRRLPESRDPNAARRLDWAGAVLATLGLGSLVYGLIEAPARGWGDGAVLATLAVGVVALAAFVAVEARGRAPMMPLGLFRSRTFSGANGLTLLLYAALGGALYFLPFNLIRVQNYSSTAAGAAFLPAIFLMFGLSRWTGGLIGRFGSKRPLVVGPTIGAVGFALMALPGVGGGYWTTFFPAVVLLGLGLAITVPPLTTTVMGAVEQSHAGLASGINNAVARTASLLAIAIFGIVISGVFGGRLNEHLVDSGLPVAMQRAVTAQSDRLAGIEAPTNAAPDQQARINRAVASSFVAGFRVVMLCAAAMALASAAVAWWLVGGKPANDRTRPGAAAAETRRVAGRSG